MFSAVYTLLIGPLELFFELVFSLANHVFHNPGISIVFLSLAMNFLVLPLYNRADTMQAEASAREKEMQPGIAHIRKTFTGDERFMMLQTYYRQNNYKPTDALKGSVSLLLEIPFFIAAYNFLSDLEALQFFSFGPIQNLGMPDGLLAIGGLTINVLPILMTAINIASGAIYTKGLSNMSKLQVYGMAAIFLVLLYQSPSGLLIYWTLNNLFSLAKNIFYKLKNPAMTLCAMISAVGAAALVYVGLVHPMPTFRSQVMMCGLLALLQLPLAGCLLARKFPVKKPIVLNKGDKIIFYLGAVFLTLLTGVLIPSAVIMDSTDEFISLSSFESPLLYVHNSVLLAAGVFLIWLGVFYALASPAWKKLMGLGTWILCGAAAVDYMFFGRSYGNLSSNLQFDVMPDPTAKQQLANMLVLLVLAAVMWLLFNKKQEIAKAICLAGCLAVVGMCGFNVNTIHKEVAAKEESLQAIAEQGKPTISLSKNGKNVVVLMLDRAIAAYAPYIFNEKPELAKQFEGFTYYPNTASYGSSTLYGAPALYGGYEYTPIEMNRRDRELLVDKHTEALTVMPLLFSNAGYETTVCDPSLAGYNMMPDLSIYDDYPQIHRYITRGQFSLWEGVNTEQAQQKLKRNFFCYSLFKIAPVVCQPNIYDRGSYNEQQKKYDWQENNKIEELNQAMGLQTADNIYQAEGISEDFVSAYAVLKNLPNMTRISSEEKNTFLMMSNDTTHDGIMLQTPDYEIAAKVNNEEFERLHADRFTLNGKTMKMETVRQAVHYHANMASYIQLGNWFDYLRRQGVYDNTRIIIVSDHGSVLGHFEDLLWNDGAEQYDDMMFFNPLMMVKDFNSTEYVVDEQFMTNADVPTLATNDLIENPVNPFTGKAINSEPKNAPEHFVFYSWHWNPSEQTGTTFLPGVWHEVHEDVRCMENFRRLGEDELVYYEEYAPKKP